MDENNKIEALIDELQQAAQTYYQGNSTLMTDAEYDTKITFLKNLINDNAEYLTDSRVQALIGDVAGGSLPDGDLITHTSPMLSLGKSNSMKDIDSYIAMMTAKGATGFTFQAKLDGYAISAIYKNGTLVQVSTRGDGSIGQNMSYLINHKEVHILGLPSQLNTNSDIELRGELFLRNSQFDKINQARKKATGDEFKNSRNAVVGITKKAEQGLGYQAELTFAVYTLMINNVYTNLDILHKNESDLILVDNLTEDEWHAHGGQGDLTAEAKFKDVYDKIQDFGKLRPEFDIPTDGIVIKPYDEAYYYESLGHTAHHPLAFTAFKYPALTKNTVIKEFTISVGKTGRLTPVAVVEPVNISGTTITHVSCHNFNYVYSNNLRVGATVAVGRANDVIPQIMSVILPGDKDLPIIPKTCPECGTKLIAEDDEVPAKTLKCPNEKCSSRLFYFMMSIVGKQALDIDGLNKASLEGIINAGLITDVDSLFTLTVDKLKDVTIGKTQKGNDRHLGKVRAKKICEDIERARKQTQAYKMLNSLGFLNLGPATAKKLLSQFNTIYKVINLTREDLEKVEGFSDTRIQSFLDQQQHAQELYNRLISRGVQMNEPEEIKKTGNSFSISGIVPDGFKNRQDLVNHMEELGWTYDTTPKKTTTIMFGDESSSSSKIKKAKQLGIKIITSVDEI